MREIMRVSDGGGMRFLIEETLMFTFGSGASENVLCDTLTTQHPTQPSSRGLVYTGESGATVANQGIMR